jgi:hypothetical protein
MIRSLFVLTASMLLLACCSDAFTTAPRRSGFLATPSFGVAKSQPVPTFSSASSGLFMANEQRDVSKSGTRKKRLNRLAELEKDKVETDKGFVLKAAGGFAGLVLILVIVGLTVYGPTI